MLKANSRGRGELFCSPNGIENIFIQAILGAEKRISQALHSSRDVYDDANTERHVHEIRLVVQLRALNQSTLITTPAQEWHTDVITTVD